MPCRSDNPSSAALKQRAYRARKKNCKNTLRVDVPWNVIERLIEWGWLSPGEAQDDARLRDALEELLECWANETLTTGPIVTA